MTTNSDFITLSVGNYEIYDSNGNLIDTLNKMQSDKCVMTNSSKFLVMRHATVNQKLIEYFMDVVDDDMIVLKGEHNVIFTETNAKGKMYTEYKAHLQTFRWDTEVHGFGHNMLVFKVDEFTVRVEFEDWKVGEEFENL